MPSILDGLLAKEPETRKVEFCAIHELRESWTKARMKAAQAELNAGRQTGSTPVAQAAREDLAAANAELDRLRELIGPQMIVFRFQPVDTVTMDRLKTEHRPTESQRTDARKNGTDLPEWNVATFPPALIAAACVYIKTPMPDGEPVEAKGVGCFPHEEAQQLWTSDRWNEAERSDLFNTALAAYMTRTNLTGAELGNG